MIKKHHYAIDIATTPATLHRFPTRKARQVWVEENEGARAPVQQAPEHPAYWQVRRIYRMEERGQAVNFPFPLEG